MVVVEEQDYYYDSDSDSGDEDVDRYVFLARQPAPPGHHAEDDGAPPPTKKARVELMIIASPLAAQTAPFGSESNLASSPRAGESGSEGSHEKAEAHEHRAPREHGEAKNAAKKKRGACGKRSRSSPGGDGEADGGRDDVAAAAAAAKSAGASSGTASGRFRCSLCDRCFGSHQALGGHVLGHRKRTKIAIAAGAILGAADDAGDESAAVEVTEEPAKSIEKKDLAAARRGKAHGDGSSSSDEGKTVDGAAKHGHDHDHVDRARHKRQRKVHGKGNGAGLRKPVFAGSHDDASGNDGFGHGFTDGKGRSDGKMGNGAASLNRKVVVVAGTCHEGAIGDGNVCRTRYKCKVCGTECITGRALGGHMRKHRKRPPVDGDGGGGGGEERSPSPTTDEECRIPLAQPFGAETS